MRSALRSLACGAAAALLAAGCGPSHPRVDLETPFGVVRVELYEDRAPRTVASFLRHVDEGRFDSASFYRVRRDQGQLMRRPTGVVQGGLWAGDDTARLAPVPFESTRATGLKHTEGMVSMARFGDVNSARAEFFVVLGDQPHLDWRGPDAPGYAVFGRVVEGMEVVRAIGGLPARGELLRRPVPFRASRTE